MSSPDDGRTRLSATPQSQGTSLKNKTKLQAGSLAQRLSSSSLPAHTLAPPYCKPRLFVVSIIISLLAKGRTDARHRQDGQSHCCFSFLPDPMTDFGPC